MQIANLRLVCSVCGQVVDAEETKIWPGSNEPGYKIEPCCLPAEDRRAFNVHHQDKLYLEESFEEVVKRMEALLSGYITFIPATPIHEVIADMKLILMYEK